MQRPSQVENQTLSAQQATEKTKLDNALTSFSATLNDLAGERCFLEQKLRKAVSNGLKLQITTELMDALRVELDAIKEGQITLDQVKVKRTPNTGRAKRLKAYFKTREVDVHRKMSKIIKRMEGGTKAEKAYAAQTRLWFDLLEV